MNSFLSLEIAGIFRVKWFFAASSLPLSPNQRLLKPHRMEDSKERRIKEHCQQPSLNDDDVRALRAFIHTYVRVRKQQHPNRSNLSSQSGTFFLDNLE